MKVDRIVLDGTSGDVTVRTSAIAETRITRIVRSGSDPQAGYTLTGTQLHLSGDCGPDCSVSYLIEAPAGVGVTGELTSGSMTLTGVASADVHAASGDLEIRGATGPVKARTESGDVTVADSAGAATLGSSSGDVHAINVGGAVDAMASSGNIDVQLTAPASIRAIASSGNVDVIVPAGGYQLRTNTSSGDATVQGVTDDPKAKNVLSLTASSGDISVTARPAA